MSKDNQNCNTRDSIDKNKTLQNGYGFLSIEHRKNLGQDLDRVFLLEQGWKHWKYRFLYPERNIPKKHYETYSTVMFHLLMWYLQKEVDKRISEIQQTKDTIMDLKTITDVVSDETEQAMKLIKQYQDVQEG